MKNLIFFLAFALTTFSYGQIPGVLETESSVSIEDLKTAGVSLGSTGDTNADGIDDFISQGVRTLFPFTFGTTQHLSDGTAQYTSNNTIFTQTYDGAVVSADVNSDGHIDVFNGGATSVTGNRSPIAEINFGSPTGTFNTITLIGLDYVRAGWVDYDNDGDLDLIYSGIDPATGDNRLLGYRNDGGTTFTKDLDNTEFALNVGSITFGNLNLDSFPDIFITGNDDAGVPQSFLLFNDQNFDIGSVITSGFTKVRQSSVIIKNIDGVPGDEILITGTKSNELGAADLYINNGNNTFTLMSPASALPPLSKSKIRIIDPYKDGTLVVMAIGNLDNGQKYMGFHDATSTSLALIANGPEGMHSGDILELSNGDVIAMGETENLPSSTPVVVYLRNMVSNNTDTDGDGVTDVDEGTDGTDPNDRCDFVLSSQTVEPSTAWKNDDCDNDGLSNEGELNNGTDPLNPDTDGDGVTDGDEAADGTNGTNLCSFVLSSQTLPPSTAWENADCDNDGLNNADELTIGTDPLNPDTDGDGVLDGDDNCPLEGPPGQGQTSNPDGCNTLGVEDNSLNTFVMYPNPADTSVTIELEHQTSDISIVIVNMLGQTVMTSNSLTVDVSQLSLGMYVVQVSTDIGSSAKRLMVQ
ncbi:hypothetical protein CL684_00695 [Candidatus Campbellbacteria bacterium]|nr:hypothetical protein [Candidatus Campbellbacteria bacterium]|tara:strand:+ start:9879 stop:11792 length:1914 start_codon:yes stop_codon:yes gene_type:complete